MSNKVRYEGGCLCGAMRWQADAAPIYRVICHCRTCRLATGCNGVPFVTFSTASVRFRGDTQARFLSSPGVTRTFCARCGTPLTYQHESRPGETDVTMGTLDDPDRIAPTDHIWMDHAPDWERRTHELPRHRRTLDEA